MRSWWRGWLLILAVSACALAQSLATTTVDDTVYRADGTPAGGSVVISWNAFTTASGVAVQAGSTSATIGAGGALEVMLAPNVGATPMGSYYTAVFHLNDGTTSKEYWVVPVTVAGGGPVKLASIRNQVLPTSVAMQTVMQRYYSMVDGVVEEFGSLSGVNAPMHVVFEVVDQGVSSSTPAAVLYDSFAAGVPIVVSPATCAFVVMNSVSLVGSIGSVEVTRPGSLWVQSVLPDGTQKTRLVGAAGQGVDCEAEYGTSAGTVGKVTFFAGCVPVANERVIVGYRTSGRAVARIADTASVVAESSAGASGTSRWLGKVIAPMARSSADCESAAQAVLAFATSRSAAVAGDYAMVNPVNDVWPGDVLAITSAGTTTSVLVRSVVVEDGVSEPEILRYKVKFANDWATEWADGLGLKLSEVIAADAVLPQTASDGAPTVLANLQQLSVTGLTESMIAVDAGVDPPSGGGFEVRRRDDAFGTDGVNLVLRSPVRAFSIPRVAQKERYYVRMYDASSPRVYSRWSSAVFVNAPVG